MRKSRFFFFFFWLQKPSDLEGALAARSLFMALPACLLLLLLLLPIQQLNNRQSLCPPTPDLWPRTGHKQRRPVLIPGAAPSCVPEVRQLDGTVKNKPASPLTPWIMPYENDCWGMLQWLQVTQSPRQGFLSPTRAKDPGGCHHRRVAWQSKVVT